MKSFLQNLLVFFALSLCGMMIFQWVRETHMQKEIQDLNNTIHDKLESIQNLQANVKRDEGEIQRLDGLKNQLTQTVKSNDVQISTLTKDLEKETTEFERSQKQVEAFKSALEVA